MHEHFHREVPAAAKAASRVIEFARPRFGDRNQFFEGLAGKGRVPDQQLRQLNDLRDGRKIIDGVERQLLVRGGQYGHGAVGNQQGVAVRCRACRDIHADDAARPGAVLDHHLLAEIFCELRCQDAGRRISATAGRRGYHQFHRSHRIAVLRQRAGGHCSKRCAASAPRQPVLKSCHCRSPWFVAKLDVTYPEPAATVYALCALPPKCQFIKSGSAGKSSQCNFSKTRVWFSARKVTLTQFRYAYYMCPLACSAALCKSNQSGSTDSLFVILSLLVKSRQNGVTSLTAFLFSISSIAA